MARIAGINIPPNKIVSIGLTYIHGIGLHSSKLICEKLSIPQDVRVNNLTEDQVLKITEYINKNHKVEGDLRREISLNIKRLVDLVTYRGTRHKKKLPRIRGWWVGMPASSATAAKISRLSSQGRGPMKSSAISRTCARTSRTFVSR